MPWYDYRESITTVVIENDITKIGDLAFTGCISLISITISDGVIIVGEKAFENCSSLKSITIPSGVTTIERVAFNGCNRITSITNLNSVPVDIDTFMFFDVDETSLHVESTCKLCFSL